MQSDVDLINGIQWNQWLEFGMALSLIGIGYFVGLVKKQLINKKKALNVSWSCHSQIHELLTELRVNTDASRAQIIQFHNGEYFMDGISMKKMSLTHESLAKGISQEADKMNNILISLFTPLMVKVLEDKPVIYRTVDDEHGICRNIMQTNSTVAYAVLPLKHRNSVSGYIILNWCNDYKSKRLNAEEIGKFLEDSRDYTEVHLKDILHKENS